MNFRSHTLDNGLTIVAECNDKAFTASAGFFVRTGARDESDEVAGVSHFLEHMLFKGTPNRSADDVNREFDEMGAHYNAFTSEENTVYYAAVLPEKLLPSIELLADIMRPSLRTEDFDMEKKVILEEIQMYQDQPPFGADDILKRQYFGRHSLSRSVLGTLDSVGKLSVDQMKDYFQKRYVPSNIFLAAAGKIDFDALVKIAENACGEWENILAPREVKKVEPILDFQTVVQSTATQQYIMQISEAPTGDSEDRYAAKLLATIIGDDSGSRMYWDLVDSGLVEHASLGHYEYQGAGIYYTWVSCNPDQTFDILKRLQNLYSDIEQKPITAQELKQAKSKIKARVVLGSERPRSRLFSLGGNWMQRSEYRSIQDDLDVIEAVTLDTIHRLVEEFPLTQTSTLTIGPQAEMAESLASRNSKLAE